MHYILFSKRYYILTFTATATIFYNYYTFFRISGCMKISSGQKPKKTNCTTPLRKWYSLFCLGMVPLLLLLDHFFGMDGLVWTQFIADIFTVILTYAVYWKLYKKPQKKMRGS